MTATIPAFRALPREMQQAAGAAAALVPHDGPALVLEVVPRTASTLKSANLTAFGVFSFVEAAILLVAAGRALPRLGALAAQGLPPARAATARSIMVAGGWALALLVWRLFDKPDVADRAATVGIQWGMFVRAARRPAC